MLYVAMTAAEMERCEALPPQVAWMACQFSASNEGLSNLPRSLPKDSVIILSDQTPICGHDPKTVERQLQELIGLFGPAGILLDFQRPGGQAMAAHLANALPCPVAVSECCAQGLSCPVFLSPQPLCRAITPGKWAGRALWLDAPICNQTVTVTKDGATVSDFLPYTPLTDGFFHQGLSVRYQVSCKKDRAVFTLSRGPQELEQLKIPEISHIFCLFQEFPENIA